MDAGARGRRLLQRREYKAKVSEFIPKELEDGFSHDHKGQLVYELDLKKVGEKLKRGLKNFINKPIMKDYPTQQQYQQSIQNKTSNQYNSYEPEGEMIEANSAQMKAMHDAKMKKMEDDKVAQKKKKVDEACWKGYEKKGMKTMFGKRYPNCVKKTKKEEVELEAKKSCGEGEYYCYDEQKCKPIPDGMKVGKDGMLVKEDMKGMSQKSGDKRSTESGAGMTAKGVAKYNRRTGGNLKTAVTTPPSKLKPGSKAAKRRKSFCARSRSWTGPRGKAARRRWNCSYEPELPMIIDEKKKLHNTSPLSDRVSNWSKKINEGDVYVKSNRNRLTGLPNLGKGDKKKASDTKVTGVDYKTMLQSYEPQGELIEMGNRPHRKGYKGAINSDVLKNNPNLDPLKPGDYIKLKRLSAKVDKINERKMTSAEKDKKEKYVKGMKKVKGDFTKRYGKDGKSVMYATATKMAMKEDFYKKKYDVKKGGYQKTDKMTKSNKRSGDSKAQYRELHKDLAKYKIKKLKTEGSLHSWFKGSKSKDGKPGWVNVVTGGTCASDKPGEGTPKCVSSSKRASMTKAERLSASRRKKKADPGQQSKSGAAKPTYVATDKKKKKVDEMNQGPSTPVGNYDGKIMPKVGAAGIGKIRPKGGKTIADLVKGV